MLETNIILKMIKARSQQNVSFEIWRGNICLWHLWNRAETSVRCGPKYVKADLCVSYVHPYIAFNSVSVKGSFEIFWKQKYNLFTNKLPAALWNLCQGTEYIFLFLKLWLVLCGPRTDGVIYLMDGRSNKCAIKGLKRCLQVQNRSKSVI